MTGNGGIVQDNLAPIVAAIAGNGGTPLVVADDTQILGVIYLKDTVKQGMPERFAQLRDMGVRTVMITWDNPLTRSRRLSFSEGCARRGS